ncbi:MAG: hypothetical protein LBT64_03325 [Puniceicoccales bacterium]|nr:hypothetical protein [Puniceicoccales bacterium]
MDDIPPIERVVVPRDQDVDDAPIITLKEKWGEFCSRSISPVDVRPLMGGSTVLCGSIVHLANRVLMEAPPVCAIADEISVSTDAAWTGFLQSMLSMRNTMLSTVGDMMRTLLSAYGEVARNLSGR